jgi:type I restriction enzyme S subunit
MKQSNAPNLPKGWEIKKLSEIGKVFNGNSINEKVKKDKYTNLDDGLPFIATKDIGFDSEIDYENGVRIPFNEINQFKIAPSNTPLICAEGGSAGRKIGFTNRDVCFGNKLFAFVPNKNVESKYVFYYYFSSSFQKNFTTEMSGIIGGVSMNKFKEIEIPLPPLPEQQRIVSILDKCFAAIDKAKANAEQNLKNAKELFESYLNGVFENGNWEKKKLQDVANVFGRGKSKHRPRNWEGLYGGDYPFIQTGEVRNANKYISSYTQTYNEVGLAQSKLWKKGTICITIAANIAETAILDFDACIPDSIIGFEVDEKKANLNFAYYLLQYFKAELQKLGKGSAQDNINLGTFENQFFPFPTLKDQQTIVRQLDALRAETQKLEAVYQKKIADLEELKKSILQRAFSGQLSESRLVGLKDEQDLSNAKKSGKSLNQLNPDSDNLKDEQDLPMLKKSGKSSTQKNSDSDNEFR